MARPDRFTPPPGCVVIRIEDLAALIAGQSRAAPAPAAVPGRATWEALSAVVAALTICLADDPTVGAPSFTELAPDVPPDAVTAVCLTIVGAWVRAFFPADRGAALLHNLGLMAAARGEPPETPNGDRTTMP